MRNKILITTEKEELQRSDVMRSFLNLRAATKDWRDTTEKEELQQADVVRSLHNLKSAMKDWHDTLVENVKDNEAYSRLFLKSYEAAIRQVDNWLVENCTIPIVGSM